LSYGSTNFEKGILAPVPFAKTALQQSEMVATDNTPATAALRRGRRAIGDRWQPVIQACLLRFFKRQRQNDL